MSDRPRLWTTAETAEFLGITERALVRRRQRGTGPDYVRVGRLIRYAPRDVGMWVQAQTRRPGTAPVQVIA